MAIGLTGSANFGMVQVYVLDTSLNSTDFSIDQTITLSPNPTNGILHLNNNTGAPINGIQAYDLLGRLVLTIESGPNKTQSISVHSLESGMYFVEIEIENKLIIKRFIKD